MSGWSFYKMMNDETAGVNYQRVDKLVLENLSKFSLF